MPDTAEVVLVADAVVAELVAGVVAGDVFSQSFTPVRGYESDTELQDTGTLHVDVVPVSSSPTTETRGSLACHNEVDIGIRKRFEGDDISPTTGKPTNTAVDALMLLEQEICKYLSIKRLTGHDAGFESLNIRAAWIPEQMTQLNQFTGIIRVTYHSSLAL